MNTAKMIKLLGVTLVLAFAMGAAQAEGKRHRLVIQVNSADAVTQKIAINNAFNVQEYFGADNVDIEIVAYGPGLSILTAKSGEKDRVVRLGMMGVKLSACGNTMKKVAKQTGKMPKLLSGVEVAKEGGVIRIMALQQKGYSYIRP